MVGCCTGRLETLGSLPLILSDDDSSDEEIKPLRFGCTDQNSNVQNSQEMASLSDELSSGQAKSPLCNTGGHDLLDILREHRTLKQDYLESKLENELFPPVPSSFVRSSYPPPELKAETLLDRDHNEVLAKLNFALQLVEILVNLANIRASPLSAILHSRKLSNLDREVTVNESYRRVEQIVIFVRALHMLASSLQLAQQEIAAKRLCLSPAVKQVLNRLNERYHTCLMKSQELVSLGLPGSSAELPLVCAEKLMYNYALELCQTAALDELFGNPHLVRLFSCLLCVFYCLLCQRCFL
ncbi:unnamed protein product [Soboliphyme baturini]|uniref:Non-specific serine/threonine protein kinase n=1 Tax=Soboliphyme baturini TaxID=241478 RepID=A0A183JAM9_9BILA|nr:unnamed protein product [Soboliphyme baturini]